MPFRSRRGWAIGIFLSGGGQLTVRRVVESGLLGEFGVAPSPERVVYDAHARRRVAMVRDVEKKVVRVESALAERRRLHVV